MHTLPEHQTRVSYVVLVTGLARAMVRSYRCLPVSRDLLPACNVRITGCISLAPLTIAEAAILQTATGNVTMLWREISDALLLLLSSSSAIALNRATSAVAVRHTFFFFFFHTFAFQLLDEPWSQVSPLLPPGSCLKFLSRLGFSNLTACRFFIECLITRALALSASQFVHKKKSPRIYTGVHSGGYELAKMTYARLEDNLIRHQGDRPILVNASASRSAASSPGISRQLQYCVVRAASCEYRFACWCRRVQHATACR